MYETLVIHHFNDLQAKCCKHWFFWVLFDHIRWYLIHNLTNVWRFIRVASQKRSNGAKAHNLAGQLILSRREITRPGNVSCIKAMFARVVWHVAPFCWNHIFPSRIYWRWQLFHGRFRIICEILRYLLNDLNGKCCKHWLLWSNFRSLFDTYWAVSQP